MLGETTHHVQRLLANRASASKQGDSSWKCAHVIYHYSKANLMSTHTKWANTTLVSGCSPTSFCFRLCSLKQICVRSVLLFIVGHGGIDCQICWPLIHLFKSPFMLKSS